MTTTHDCKGNPDALLRRWWALHAKLEDRPCFDPIAIRGAYCKRCGGGPKIRRLTRRGTITACASCYEPWVGEEAEVPKGLIRSGKRSIMLEEATAEFVDLEAIVVRLPTPDVQVAALHAVVGLTYFDAAERANLIGLRGAPWNERRARRATERTRDRIRELVA